MFYRATEFPRGIFKACIVPRPIAWISTIDSQGRLNLAPFSYFNAVSDDPPMVMFSTTNAHIEGGGKDTLKNAEETKEFVINIATHDMREAVNASATELPRGASEFEFSGVEHEPSTLVSPPRVKNSPINIECSYHTSVQLPSDKPDNINRLVIGRVLGIRVDPRIMTNGLIDLAKLKPIARLGYNDYATVTEFFSMKRLKPPVAIQKTAPKEGLAAILEEPLHVAHRR